MPTVLMNSLLHDFFLITHKIHSASEEKKRRKKKKRLKIKQRERYNIKKIKMNLVPLEGHDTHMRYGIII